MELPNMKIYFLFYFISFVYCDDGNSENELMSTKVDILEPANLVYWPNGTIPFFVNSDHFDNEQAMIIMSSLSLIAFKTCLKFAPVMVEPAEDQHVLTFINPSGVRKCDLMQAGHPKDEPHVVILGYDCLETPWMDRVVLRALGLPLEHNRGTRDAYIDVQYENIEQYAIPLFTKDFKLPAALRALPYDVNSVLHFGDRDYSKNGHRTIIFKNRDTKQKWEGISDLDLRKIELIYGPECRERDRQEKIELCHLYPGIPPVDRKKRSLDVETTRSLRVNPDITPPPEKSSLNISEEVQATLKSLDIEDEVQKIVEDVFKLSSKALRNARAEHCNKTESALRTGPKKGNTDVLGIIELVADYAKSVVDHAASNLTSFCEHSESVDKYERQRCPNGCQRQYYSTKHYQPYPSTKYRPAILQSTKHVGGRVKPPYDPPQYFRAQEENATDTTEAERKRRQVDEATIDFISNNEQKAEARKTTERVKREIHIEAHPRENKRKRKRPVSEMEEESREKDSVEIKIDELTRDDREGKRKRTRPMTPVSETEEKLHERDTVEVKIHELTRDSREGKRKRKRPVSEMEEQHRESDSVEVKIDDLTVTREGKRKRKRPVSEFEEKGRETNSMEDNEGVQTRDETRAPKKKQKKEETLPPEYVDDLPDSVETDAPKAVLMSKANKEFYKERRWPGGVVRYVIDQHCTQFDVADLRQRLAEVNDILRLRTCARIEEIRQQDTNTYDDYLVLDNSPDFVTGRVGGRQIFGSAELLEGGQHRQHAAMLVMAMLGFYFELSRHDRDQYVKVHSRHVRPDKLHHFEKIGADATLPLRYDYESATHPAWMFWRKLGKKGISTVATYKDKDPDGSIMKSLGQHKKLLSEGDIIKINTVYGVKCMTKGKKPKRKHNKDD